jgi:sugar phosphate isomerase/epimerase
MADEGFSVPAMQAIFFGKPRIKLFDVSTWAEQIRHIRLLAKVAEALECRVLVFGAPKMRHCGGLSHQKAITASSPILMEMAKICHDHGTKLCIEPNSREYGCNFVWTTEQAIELINTVNHPGFGLHMDASAMSMEHEIGPEKIRKYINFIEHFHVSEPSLAGLQSSRIDHLANLLTLQSKGYDKWVSLESIETEYFIHSIDTLSGWKTICKAV